MAQIELATVTYIGVLHEVPADFEAILPALNALSSNVSSSERLAVFREYGGIQLDDLRRSMPNLATRNAISEARSSYATVRQQLASIHDHDQSGNWLMLTIESAKFGQDSFWKAFDRWLDAEQGRAFGETLTLDAWLDALWAESCRDEANRVLRDTRLSTDAAAKEYLLNIDEYVDAMASSVRQRNAGVVAQVARESQRSDHVAVPIGCAHVGLVQALREVHLHVIESERSSSYRGSPVSEFVTRLSLGELVPHSARELGSLQDIVWQRLMLLARQQRGPFATARIRQLAGEVATRWTADEVIAFVKTCDTGDAAAARLLKWLERHGTPDEQSLWQPDPEIEALRNASAAVEHLSKLLERLGKSYQHEAVVVGESGFRILGPLAMPTAVVHAEIEAATRVALPLLERAGFGFRGHVTIPASYEAFRAKNLTAERSR